jgi:nitrate/TMAO reductase-like tetraheme cytochrome c subunit
MPDPAANPQSERPRHFLWRRPRSRWLLGIPIGGFLLLVIGLVLSSGFAAALHMSNTLQFCTSCHEMSDNMYAEYQQSPHYKNAAGVRAVCSDCHVPHEFFPKMRAKFLASIHELPRWAMGTVNTKEKFTAVRLEMANHVWAQMKATDSRECRNCHTIEAMDLEAQESAAAKKHNKERMLSRGETCIDCHKGIGHGLPPGYE